jgi:hypothetical protein
MPTNSQQLAATPLNQQINQQKLILWLLLITHSLTFLLQLPTIYDLATFALFDPGVTLRTDLLLTQGFIPTIDFGYPYGMFPLMIGRVWFAALGRTPLAYVVFMFIAEAFILWGLWRITSRGAWQYSLLLFAALPHAIIPVYLHLTHPLEAALIIHAIADLLDQRRARALAIATVSLFVKPVMGYVFGFLVILLLAVNVIRKRESLSDAVNTLRPAALIAIVCTLISVWRYGFTVAYNSLIPANGAQSYQALDFGFFGNGKTFWLPRLATAAQFAKYYLFTPAGFWIVCTLLAAIFGMMSLFKWWQSGDKLQATSVITSACHFIFIFSFFGWPGSWTYYAALLFAAVITGMAAHRVRPIWFAALIALALCGHRERFDITVNAWQKMTRDEASAGLWSFPDLRHEWQTARQLAGSNKILYLNNGCAEILFPNIEAPASFFLSPATQTPLEITRIRQQMQNAQVVVTFNQAAVLDSWNWPEFAAERAAFQTKWQGKYLTFHSRSN